MISDANPNRFENVASLIDHTLLSPAATRSDIARLCSEARLWGFASVCVNPYRVAFAGNELAGSAVKVCTVIGFPLGANDTRTKLAEAEIALAEGALELDMVQNIGALRSGELEYVSSEVAALAKLVKQRGALLKVILETSLLSAEEKTIAARLAREAGADFVKTSTGFGGGGATVEDVQLLKREAGAAVRVKASGGIRTLAALREMVRAGASRIGTSSGVQILDELAAREQPAAADAGQAGY